MKSADGRHQLHIFVSYAHKDEELKDELVAHLAFLKREGSATVWHDLMIDGGDEFHDSIQRALAASEIILLLVSPDFIASDFIDQHELAEAMRRHEEGSARVIPVILRPCRFQHLSFGRLNALPRFAKAVTSFDDRDSAFVEVAVAIDTLVKHRIAEKP